MKHHDEPPPSLRSLRARLTNVCKEENLVFGRTQRHLAVVIIGHLLSTLDGVAAIKGATNLEARLGTRKTRVSADLDTTVAADLAEFAERFREHLREGWAGFTGTLSKAEEIQTPTPQAYRPHRFRLSLLFHGRPFTSLTFEVAPDEIDGLSDVEHVNPTEATEWMRGIGLPAPAAIPMLRLDHQIAQKLHACTAPDVNGWTNERVHDLIDLQLANQLYQGSTGQLRSTAVRLFAARGGHSWPPVVSIRQGWADRYPELARDLPVVPTLDDAVAWCNELIRTLDRSTENERRARRRLEEG